MATKSEQFSVKISCLKGALVRLESGKSVAATDSGTITSLMKYFKQVILSVQCERSSDNEVLSWPAIVTGNSVSNSDRWESYLASYPSLDYSTLHDMTLSILQFLPFTLDTKDACACSLEMLSHTLPFVHEELRVELPLQVSSLLPKGDFDFHGLIIDALCDSIIPMCFVCTHENKDVLSAAVSSILTILFEFVTDPPLHMKLVETLMLFKKELWKDMLMVTAYASEPVKICAVRYLFHYWPDLHKHEMSNHVIPLSSMPAMICCENKSCKSKNDIVATSALFDPALSACYGWKNAPLYLCDTCKNTVRNRNKVACFFDILLRKETISYSCENKNCFSQNMTGFVTVCGCDLSSGPGKTNGDKLLDKHRTRYCNECYNNLVKFFPEGRLLVQYSPSIIWKLPRSEDRTVLADAISSLLNDSPSAFVVPGSCEDLYDDQAKTSYLYLSAFDGSDVQTSSEISVKTPDNFNFVCRACCDNLWNNSGSAQGQFGIWLLMSLCPISPEFTMDEVHLNTLLSSTIQWCADSTYLPNDEYGSKLENLKFQLMEGWITDISVTYFKQYTSHLLPKKQIRDVAQQWYNLCPPWQNYCIGLRLILCLGSYSIIREDTWNKIMPQWIKLLDQKFDEIKENEELRDVVTKLFDVKFSPLPFESKYLFEFALQPCEKPDITSQTKGLSWLLVLTEIGAVIPVVSLLDVFLNSTHLLTPLKEQGVAIELDDIATHTGMNLSHQDADSAISMKKKTYFGVLECFTTMMNILQKQINLREIGTSDSVLSDSIGGLLMLMTEQLAWICDGNQDNDSTNTHQGAGSELFGKGDEEIKLMDDLPVSWLWKAYDILQVVLAKKMDKKTSFVSEGAELEAKETLDENSLQMLKLSLKLTKVLSSQCDQMQQHITLQILDLLCESCSLSGALSVPNNDCNPDDFAIQFFQLWTKLPSDCFDLFNCATSVLLRTLYLPAVAESFISHIKELLASTEWIMRYDTTNKIQYLLDSVQQHHVQKRSCFTHVISSCFCSLLARMDDEQLEVQMKCRHVIENISLTSLKHVSGCLELEFTAVPHLRTNLLIYMETINQLRPEANLFSVFYSGCIGFVMKHGRNTHDRGGLGGYGLQQKWQDVAMARETVHLLFAIISKYIMDYPGRSKATETRCFQSMLKNFFAHFGYNDQIGIFTFKPLEIRSSIGFSSFVLNLPKILDNNINLGSTFIGTVITLLEDCISPEFGNDRHKNLNQLSLSVLPEPVQLAWISSLLLLLYKFNATDHSQLMQLERLVVVCLNALETEIHLCSSEHTLLHFQAHKNENADVASDTQFDLNSAGFFSQPDVGTGNALSRLSQASIFGHHITPLDKNDTHNQVSVRTTQKSVRASKLQSQDETDPLMSPNTTKTQIKTRDTASMKSRMGLRGLSQSGNGASEDHMFSADSNNESNGEDDDYTERKKRSSASLSSSSQSPYRRRNNSDISRDWNKIMAIPLQSAVMNPSCHKCNEKLFGFSPKVLSGCILNMCYFVKFNVELATPLLPRILTQLVYITHLLGDGVREKQWKSSLIEGSTLSSSHLAYSNVSRVARQCIRCILQQLTSSLLLTKMFLLPLEDNAFLHGLAVCLSDYQNLNSLTAVKCVLDGLPQDLKTLSDPEFNCLLANLASYIDCLPQDSQSCLHWQQLLGCFTILCNKLNGVLQFRERCNTDGLFSIIVILLNSPSPLTSKQNLMESFTKLLVAILQRCNFSVKSLHTLCCTSCKVFTRTKEKFFLMRYVVSEIISCLKLKSMKFLHENVKLKSKFLHENVLMLLQLMLVDVGSCLNPCAYQSLDSRKFVLTRMNVLPCYMMECIKSHLPDCLEIIADLDFLNNLKEHVFCNQSLILHGPVCADVKVSIAQLICVELSQTAQQDKALQSLLPWICETISSVQQGPKDYVDCISHIRQLSWILLGSLTHIGLFYSDISSTWQPLPVEISSHLAGIVQVILTGFPVQYMESLTSLSSLFYVFVFCQLWTLYCDEMSWLLSSTNSSVQGSSVIGWDQNLPSTLIMEFWSRVTPSILILLQQPHNKSISDLVHVHITSIMECLQDYNSAVVFKLYSLWKVMLESHLGCNSSGLRSSNSHDTCMEARLNKVQCFYTYAFNDDRKKSTSNADGFDQSSQHATESGHSGNKLLEIVGQIKERLAQVEIAGQAADDLYIVH